MKSESVLVIHFWLSLCSSLCFSLAEVVGNIESVAIGEVGAAGTSLRLSLSFSCLCLCLSKVARVVVMCSMDALGSS